jgi:N-formylglutamate deformylase
VNDTVFTLHQGPVPLLVSLPHIGTAIPEGLRGGYVERALASEDTDWHLNKLYGFVGEMGASVLMPKYSRYVIDLNRSPENIQMYSGTNNTELCPTHFFSGDALYREGAAPNDAEIARRLDRYWQPYHDALNSELQRLKSIHGYAILFEGHSIKSELPWLFEGRLPALNLGTVDGESCAASMRKALSNVLQSQTQFSHVVDARFKGGYITRHYGQPDNCVHAVQLEMCWRCYMEECPPFIYDTSLAANVQPLLRTMIQTLVDWRCDV